MADLIVQPAKIEKLRVHENADSLEIAEVLGWQLVVGKNNGYEEGQTIVYFPPDTLVPRELAEELGVAKYLSEVKVEPNFLRVRAAKLRGEISFGMTAPIPEGTSWEPGENVSDYFGAKKYEPPLRASAGDAVAGHPLFVTYTDIENLRNYPETFVDGEPIRMTEKIHGTNCRIGLIDGEVMAGSKGLQRKHPITEGEMKSNTYWFPYTIPGVAGLLEDYQKHSSYKQVILFGEVYGSPVQKLNYGLQGKIGFRAFDLLIDGKYADPHELDLTCGAYGIETVPTLYEGPFSLDVVREHADGPTTLDADHIREGVVISPLIERTNLRVGRVKMKYLGDKYLMKTVEGKIEDNTDQ